MDIIKKKHIGVYGIIMKENSIALIKKARGGYKGKLDLPGGGMEHAELPIETLHRELKEEAGVTVTSEELFDVTATNIVWQIEEDKKEDLHHIGIIYNVETKESCLKSSPDGLDSNGCDWYDISSLDINELSPFARFVVERIK